MNAAPFFLGTTLKYYFNNVPDYFQQATFTLKKSVCVHNCVVSCYSEEVINFIEQPKEIMSSVFFYLRDCIGNSLQPKIFGIPEKTFLEETVSVLRLNWNILGDTFYCCS